MDKSAKEQAIEMTEKIMQLSLHYCKDSDDEIAAYSIRINTEAHNLKKIIERRLINQSHN